jgi:hypothetical protein
MPSIQLPLEAEGQPLDAAVFERRVPPVDRHRVEALLDVVRQAALQRERLGAGGEGARVSKKV